MTAPDRSQADEITLQNSRLSVRILPRQGARIASLFDALPQTEFLFEPRQPYRRPQSLGPWDRFENSACAGIDECLPSVGACGPDAPGGPVPDHGDFWRLAWTKTSLATKTSVSLAAVGYSRPLRFRKTLRLHSSALEIRYSIGNLGNTPLPFLYAFHPLFAVDAGDRILLPPEVATARVDSSKDNHLGPPGSVVAWPRPHGKNVELDLSRAQAVSASTADMLYTGRVHSGWCGLYRAQRRQGLILRFDPSKLPYLGLWLCYGGWPGDLSLPRQYAVAFEPTVAPWGTLSAASEHRQAPLLAPRERFEFTLVLQCAGAGAMTCGEFAAQCAETFIPN